MLIKVTILHKPLFTICRLVHTRILSSMGYNLPVENVPAINNNPPTKAFTPKQNRARAMKVIQHLTNEAHLKDIKNHIPSKYFTPKRRNTLQHMYLIDKQIARSVALHILPYLLENKDQVVCETNAGLGLISLELLKNGIELIRLYETCPDFRQILRNFSKTYPNKVELFTKDIYNLRALSSTDKYDHGNRVVQILKGIPSKKQSDDPAMTIIGPMPSLKFISYVIRMIVLQQEIAMVGPIQIFTLMKPPDYIRCTSTPEMGLRVYHASSILFQLFFECRLIEKYPRKSFLPWETKLKDSPFVHTHTKTDMDYIYFVQMVLKKTLPVETQHLLHLYFFIKEGFQRGKPKIIPTVEKWLPGIGANLIVPTKQRRQKSFTNMSIYTEFGHLTPVQILQIFLEMLDHPEYHNSPFVGVVESQLLRTETVETDLADIKSIDSENLKETM